MAGGLLTLFVCGDVMLGRGVDQILPHPGDPQLREPYMDDARQYVRLAELVSGPIPQPASFSWPWGDALEVLDDAAPDARVINLEVSVTRSDDFSPGKAVHYRMNPDNLASLIAGRPDACALANNHVLDFGRTGLHETLDALAGADAKGVGAGPDAVEANQPATVAVPAKGRVVVFSCGAASSGIPPNWAATDIRPGVAFLPDLSEAVADDLISRVQEVKRPGDVVIVSVHWGSNWGYHVDQDQVRFARLLVDGGVDLIHGHSSHHPRPVELYHGKLILYGCGDFIDDYEGIGKYGEFRDDLRLLYLASLAQDTGNLEALRMVPMQACKMRLRHASSRDSEWLRGVLETISSGFGSHVSRLPDGALLVRPALFGRPQVPRPGEPGLRHRPGLLDGHDVARHDVHSGITMIGAAVGCDVPPSGSMVRPTRSPARMPAAITGLVMPSRGKGSIPADRSPAGPMSQSW